MTPPLDNDASFLGRILAGISASIILVDPTGIIRYINHVEPGYDRARVIGSEATDFVLPASRELSALLKPHGCRKPARDRGCSDTIRSVHLCITPQA